jgi:uncharacterized membrane protein YtjA (UPF0391 family)
MPADRAGGKAISMLRWALIFLIIGLVAAALGVGGIAGPALEIARVLLVVFIILLVISLIAGRRVV